MSILLKLLATDSIKQSSRSVHAQLALACESTSFTLRLACKLSLTYAFQVAPALVLTPEPGCTLFLTYAIAVTLRPTHRTCTLTLSRLQGFDRDQLSVERYLNLRYDGTDVAVMTLCPEGDDFAKASIFHVTCSCSKFPLFFLCSSVCSRRCSLTMSALLSQIVALFCLLLVLLFIFTQTGTDNGQWPCSAEPLSVACITLYFWPVTV